MCHVIDLRTCEPPKGGNFQKGANEIPSAYGYKAKSFDLSELNIIKEVSNLNFKGVLS